MRTPSTFRRPRLAALSVCLAAFLVAGALLVAGDPAEAAPAPTLTSAAPASGPLAGGTVVTLTGTGFDAGATVDFGGTPAAVVNVVSATSITATTPAHATGDVVVTVTNGDGQAATLTGGFRFLGPPPTLASIDPATGGTVGGTLITLTGTEFASGATVTVDGRAATSVTAVNGTTVTALAPWGVAGVVDVVYTGADGQTVTLPASFTYTQSAPPSVTAVSPASGSHGGGTVVTITGTGFVSGATVRFGANAATGVTFVSATTLRASAPAGTAATTVPVTVTNPDSQTGTRANAFAYVNLAAPTVTAVSPAAGPLGGGTSVTVTGTNFNDGAVVKFGANTGTVVSVQPTSIVVVTPAQTTAGKVEVRVTNTDTKNAALTAAFAYQAAPTVTAIAPAKGSAAGGTAITLTGTNFVAGMTVRIGGVLATDVKVTGLTTATAVTPAGTAGVTTVVVTNADAQTATLANAGFTYIDPPAITSISPVAGPDSGGTAIVISGSGFATGVTVTVGGTAATGVVLVDSTRITAVVPAGTAGAAPVVVTSADGLTNAGAINFIYTATSGTITAGSVPSHGLGLVVFGGGTTSMLLATVGVSGCTASDVTVFAANGKGAFVSYLASAPSFVNAAWAALFPDAIPANQPLLIRCA